MFSSDDLPNRFDYATAQPRIYAEWEARGYFHSEPDPKRKPEQDKSVKVDAVRGVVIEMVEATQPKSAEEAEAAYDRVIASGPIAELLKSSVTRTMGPPQGTPVAGQRGQGKYFNIPQEQDA